MYQIENDETCRHAECECRKPGADDYCSKDCRIAEENGKRGGCPCGHVECSFIDA
ncbi:MAG: hypothetical protein KDB79_14550 [Acidobacteria bacterium]|nr:hypothetical protein [Acidobacteriota bacterium]